MKAFSAVVWSGDGSTPVVVWVPNVSPPRVTPEVAYADGALSHSMLAVVERGSVSCTVCASVIDLLISTVLTVPEGVRAAHTFSGPAGASTPSSVDPGGAAWSNISDA